MGSNPNPWAPYDTYKDCSQGICSIYCPQWCYIIFPPPPPSFTLEDDDSATDFSPLIIAVIGILASAFILVSYFTIISKYCGRRGSQDATALDFNQNRDEINHDSWPNSSSSGLDDALIKSITVCKYLKNDGLIEGTDCSVCLSEFQEDESLRLLPKCNHAFHVPCIDTWLKSHSTCPLCRANISTSTNHQVIVSVQETHPNVSALQYQHRVGNDTVLVIHDLDLGVQEEAVLSLVSNQDVPKTPTQGLRNHSVIDIRQDGNEIQGLRRSVSLNSCLGQGHVSIADILCARDDDDDDDDVDDDNHMRDVEKKGSRVSPLAMKRSVSTGRFIFSGYGKYSICQPRKGNDESALVAFMQL